MPKQLTIRGVPDEIAERIEALSRGKGQSVNATVLEVLAHAFDVQERARHLESYVTWSEEEFREFEANLAEQRRIDPNDWK